MVIIVNGKMKEENEITRYLRQTYLPSRLILCVYLVGKGHPHVKVFPVNYLRNLAIRNIQTTHYIIMDMDVWPTGNSHSIEISFT